MGDVGWQTVKTVGINQVRRGQANLGQVYSHQIATAGSCVELLFGADGKRRRSGLMFWVFSFAKFEVQLNIEGGYGKATNGSHAPKTSWTV